MSQKLGSRFGLANTRSFGQIGVYNSDREGFKLTERARRILYDGKDRWQRNDVNTKNPSRKFQ